MFLDCSVHIVVACWRFDNVVLNEYYYYYYYDQGQMLEG